MVCEVLIYPDKKLRQKSVLVHNFDDTLGQLLDNLYDTMIAQNGIGIAAIQIGVAQRALVINTPNEEGEQVRENLLEIVNPTIISNEGGATYNEGCLSVPGYYDEVERSEKILLRYFDRRGNAQELEATGLLAIAVQHELDHLDGRLFIEKLPLLVRKKFEKEWKKSHKNQ
ncbi:peptide deformylase [Campylobacterota bacterium]|nr:peptide deformylase [Campylobacterota bacterium]